MATVSDDTTHAGLQIDPALRDFVADELLPGLVDGGDLAALATVLPIVSLNRQYAAGRSAIIISG